MAETLPLHLREVAALPDPRMAEDASSEEVHSAHPDKRKGVATAGDAFLKALLAPVRSGMILTRRDLLRAGNALNLGVRQGERLYILKAFLSQDPQGTLRWLADEARRWVDLHRSRREAGLLPDTAPESLPYSLMITTFWEDRAEASASLLEELAGEAGEIENG